MRFPSLILCLFPPADGLRLWGYADNGAVVVGALYACRVDTDPCQPCAVPAVPPLHGIPIGCHLARAGARAPQEVWALLNSGRAHPEANRRGGKGEWSRAVRAPNLIAVSLAHPSISSSIAINTHSLIEYLMLHINSSAITVRSATSGAQQFSI